MLIVLLEISMDQGEKLELSVMDNIIIFLIVNQGLN